MRRRAFLGLLGGAATWPVGAGAQQGGRVRRIGVLMNLLANDTVAKARVGAFQQGLQQLGWTEGRDLQIDYRWTAGGGEELRKYAIELVALAPDAILATGSPPVVALRQATLYCAARFRAGRRSGRGRLRGKPGAAGRQCHGIYAIRIQHQRQMAGTAERDRAKRDARRCAARADQSRRHRPVCWNPNLRCRRTAWRCDLSMEVPMPERSSAQSQRSRASRMAV